MNYHLCPHGWALYDRWSAALERKDKEVAAEMRKDFDKHRRKCAECTKPMKEKRDDRNNQPE